MWLQVAELRGSDTTSGDWFGSSIAIDGANVVVGAPAHAANTGSAYVFTDGPGGWTQAAELTGQLADGYFGYAVAVSGTTVIVGGPGKTRGIGHAYVFTANAGTWTQVADFEGGPNFGAAVAVSGRIAVVGAWLRSGGAAYVFTDTSGPWAQAARLNASDHPAGFGAVRRPGIAGGSCSWRRWSHGRPQTILATPVPAGASGAGRPDGVRSLRAER
jgi:hypothetical protein